MQLKDTFVLKFQTLYEQTFQETLSYEEAYAECMDMIILGKILFRPVTRDDVQALEKSDEN